MKVKHLTTYPKILKIFPKIFKVLFFFAFFMWNYSQIYMGNILENTSEVKLPSQGVQLTKYDSVNAPKNSWAIDKFYFFLHEPLLKYIPI